MNHSASRLPQNKKAWRFKPLRVAGLVLLGAVLTLAFVGHLTPDMKVQWANFMSMCGF